MSCGVDPRHGSDLMLLWLWCRLAATAPIRHLAWELPHAASEVLRSKKKKKKERKKELKYEILLWVLIHYICRAKEARHKRYIPYFSFIWNLRIGKTNLYYRNQKVVVSGEAELTLMKHKETFWGGWKYSTSCFKWWFLWYIQWSKLKLNNSAVCILVLSIIPQRGDLGTDITSDTCNQT